MENFLKERLPAQTWKNRLVCERGMCFMEFSSMDVDRLARLGIQVDQLGPKLFACLWDDSTELEVGGYLVVDNLAMGRPSMGGIRMVPEIPPTDVYNLARAMTLKNAAANLPYGGGKASILTNPSQDPDVHTEVVRRFAQLLYRYRDIFLPGPDVGTNDADMKTIAIETGLDNALSKPADMGGSRIDVLGAAGGGLVIAIDELLKELPRLQILPQFANLPLPEPKDLTVLLQGFGSVGAHAARILHDSMPEARIIGVSDASGYIFDEQGLPVDELFKLWRSHHVVAEPYFESRRRLAPGKKLTKYSNEPNDLLRESAFCLIPAAPIANYLDTDPGTHPCMTTDRIGKLGVIVEGANTYSPDPLRKTARARMERAVYRERGILIVPDYLVNSGGVIFAAQENLIKTPGHLRIPDELLGNREAVDHWLAEHTVDLEALAEQRRMAAEKAREEVIRQNIRELIDMLLADSDTLPCEAAEQISVQRMTQRERKRTAADIMERIVTLPITSNLKQAAELLVDAGSPILAVLNSRDELAGVLTDWDITLAAAEGLPLDTLVDKAMTRSVITASPTDTILDIVRKLEYHEISALPIVRKGEVLGMVSSDLLARRSLEPLLIVKPG
jgi:glutamate dehydrogenase (NAD(P)+)